MKARLHITTLLLVLISISTNAQKTKMILNYKDGKSVEGYGKLVSEKKIKFKTSRKAKAKKLSYDDLKSVTDIKYYSDDGIETYEFIAIKDGKIKLLERTLQGKVTLYRRVRITGGAYMPMGGGGFGGGNMMWTGSNIIKNYYVKRKGESVATHLGSNQLFTKSFKNAMSDYVKDCPKLVNKIESKELKKRDLTEIIDFYNTKCE